MLCFNRKHVFLQNDSKRHAKSSIKTLITCTKVAMHRKHARKIDQCSKVQSSYEELEEVEASESCSEDSVEEVSASDTSEIST